MNRLVMTNCIDTLLKHGNGSRSLNLDRIASFQGFDPVEFRAAFLDAETRKSLTPSDQYGEGK